MLPLAVNGTLQSVIDRCRACRGPAEALLAELRGGREPGFAESLRCVALLTVVGDTLEAEGDCRTELIDAAIELARELPDDPAGCASACCAAADALSEWLDGDYERQ